MSIHGLQDGEKESNWNLEFMQFVSLTFLNYFIFQQDITPDPIPNV